MLEEFGPSTVLAIVFGGLLAVAAFVPVVAVRYRRAGQLRPLDLVLLLGVAAYAVALWTYTLVPVPETQNFTCRPSNRHLLQFIDDIRAEGGSLLRNRAFFQAAFNVVLFMPLGAFLRIVWRRGVVAATAIGLATTLAIEFTQLTGIWGLFRCAYRTFDVDDLLLNTSGAIIGSLFALPIASLMSRRTTPSIDHVTLGRRLVGMLCDVMVSGFLGIAPTVLWRGIALYLLDYPVDELPQWVDLTLSFVPPAIVQSWWVLVRGRTVGEAIVQLEPFALPTRTALRRALKLLFGVGGWLLFSLGPEGSGPGAVAFALVSIVVAAATRNHRGLSHLLSGMDLRVEPPQQQEALPPPA